MKTLLGIVIAFFLLVFGIGLYLSPDDLAGCGDKPNGTPPCEQADAIVAISGGDTSARTAEAVRLYKEGWADKLIFSGAALDKSGPSNAQAMSHEAEAAGVPAEDIILEEFGESTKQNAQNSQDIFDLLGIKKVILVTSGYHQRRASLEFGALSTGATLRNHPISEDGQWSAWWWLTPSGWYLAVSEIVKIIIFYAGGGR